jgi:F0F1-type ATP synthase assembly protein I
MSKENKTPTQKPEKQLSNYAIYSGLIFQMMAMIGLGVFVGYKLDQKYPNKHQLFTVVFSLLSVVLSVFYVVKRIIALSK